MKELIDLTGKRFGRLEVLYEVDKKQSSDRIWKCKCSCGTVKNVRQRLLITGKTKSCGCIRKEELVKRSTKHNCSHTRIYGIYAKMKKRCYSENDKRYKDYGGRGIVICSEWLGEHGFENFYKWSVEHGYDDSLTIERINNDGNYEPSNCRWATYREQNRNKRNNIVITMNGQTKILKDWCIELGMDYQSVKMRIHKGWNAERALTEPIRHIKRVV